MSRPEHIAPAEYFYDSAEAAKYGGNSRMIQIQTKMTERALEFMQLTPGKTILDIGCGSGISGEVLTEHGHYWVGMDISPSMLLVALARETEGDLILSDMGQGFNFRPGSFDACISISAIQWLCNRDKANFNPFKRAVRFFQSVYNSLVKGGKAVMQFYPQNAEHIEMLTSAALKAGFTGGIVVDYPHSAKAKKYFLVLNAGAVINHKELQSMAKTGSESDEEMDVDSDQDMDQESDEEGGAASSSLKDKKDKKDNKMKNNNSFLQENATVKVEQRTKEIVSRKKRGKMSQVKTKDWIVKKKEQQRTRGQKTAADSKFTGRKRRPKF